jgi:hypothetical protein
MLLVFVEMAKEKRQMQQNWKLVVVDMTKRVIPTKWTRNWYFDLQVNLQILEPCVECSLINPSTTREATFSGSNELLAYKKQSNSYNNYKFILFSLVHLDQVLIYHIKSNGIHNSHDSFI